MQGPGKAEHRKENIPHSRTNWKPRNLGPQFSNLKELNAANNMDELRSRSFLRVCR